MKYIKTYELLKYDASRPDLIPGYVYKENGRYVGYIGHNGAAYPLLFLLFTKDTRDNFYFIDWIESLAVTSTETTIIDFIKSKNLIDDTFNAIDKKNFSSGPSGTDGELIETFREQLLLDEDIQLHMSTNKYNL